MGPADTTMEVQFVRLWLTGNRYRLYLVSGNGTCIGIQGSGRCSSTFWLEGTRRKCVAHSGWQEMGRCIYIVYLPDKELDKCV